MLCSTIEPKILYYTECPRFSARILNICVEKITVRSIFTTWQRNCQKCYACYLFYPAHVNVRMRQFQDIWIPDGHSANNKGSSGRGAVKWRQTGKELSEQLFHVVKAVLSYLCLFSKQKCLKCVHSFSDVLHSGTRHMTDIATRLS
jgi:hypothetical protein